MANFRYVLSNLAVGATITLTSQDADYPSSSLVDGRPSRTSRFAAAAADDNITIDLLTAKNVDVCSIHLHNIDSGVTAIQLRSSTDNFAASDTLEATFTKRDPAFYVRLPTPVNRRYWRVKFVGTNSVPIEIGELVLGLSAALLKGAYRMEVTPRLRQIRTETAAGEEQRFSLNKFASDEFVLSFRGSKVEMDDFVNMLQQTELGAQPIVVVPDDSLDRCYLGRWLNEYTYRRDLDGKDRYHWEETFAESAFGVSLD